MDLSLVEELVLVVELLRLLPPLAEEVFPLLLASFARCLRMAYKLPIIPSSLLILALQDLFAIVDVLLEGSDFVVSLLEVAVDALGSHLLVLLPSLVILSIQYSLQLFPSLFLQLLVAFRFVLCLDSLQFLCLRLVLGDFFLRKRQRAPKKPHTVAKN